MRICAEFMGEHKLDIFNTDLRLSARFVTDIFLSEDALLESFLDG